MIGKAFTMKLKKGLNAEYKKRHDEIWPDLARELSEVATQNYSIFLDSATLTLFAYQELDEINSAGSLNERLILERWYDQMMVIMDTNDDHSPRMNALPEVFRLQ
jgi:L-rhamnose mutarotase